MGDKEGPKNKSAARVVLRKMKMMKRKKRRSKEKQNERNMM